MKSIGQKGLALIERFEGLRLQAYQDSVGIWTIGWGHIEGVHEGMSISRQEAENLLRQDVTKCERCVNMAVTVPIDQNEFDALVSFAFNCGCSALLKSTLLKKLNAKDYAGAANEFLKWNKAGGKELKGLTNRRMAERELFLSQQDSINVNSNVASSAALGRAYWSSTNTISSQRPRTQAPQGRNRGDSSSASGRSGQRPSYH